MSKEGGNQDSPQGGDTSKKDSNADLYENRGTKKIIRLVTVMAYMFSVSFVAIVLSAYYLFLWEPPNPKLIRRPVHLSSEPEIQFLLADEPNLPNDVSMNDFLSVMATEQKGSNTTRKKSFGGRIADDHYSGKKHRRTLNESLALLRNSLVEFMRNRINDSKFNGDLSTESNEKNKTDFSKMIDRTFKNNATFLTLNSSAIPGDEVNNDRFTSTRNRPVFKTVLYTTEDTIVAREENKRSVSKSFGKENSSESLSKVKEFANSNEGFVNGLDTKEKYHRRSRGSSGKLANVASDLKEEELIGIIIGGASDRCDSLYLKEKSEDAVAAKNERPKRDGEH
ncbi:uncharacterized protein LOC114872853 isoform X2 [Osmia bicornis bicornis]|uniref:uncharacterized protein LOC114872853 isoform X2 n=1 Tax=Osmia bicornis bicornis TaxID=1437191 RepID=UPI001EAEEC0D|nr:uncharacterized protein LOC114872853 isoform X2 [Osmia bicornis bicornis]